MGRSNRKVTGGPRRVEAQAVPAAMPARVMDEPVTGEMTGEVASPPEGGSLALWHESDRRDRAQLDHVQRDHELEHQFFSAGLSQDNLLAASERAQDEELLRPATSGLHKAVVGVAVCATVGVLAAGLVMRGPHAGSDPRATAQAAADEAVVAATPPAALGPAPEATAPVAAAVEAAAPAAVSEAGAAVLDVGPGTGDPRPACSQALLAGRFRDIRDRCLAAFTVAPEAELAGEVARLAIENGRPSDAVRWARRALEVDPAFAPAYVYLGGGEQQRGNPRAARVAYERYLELAPDGPYAGDVQALLAADEPPLPPAGPAMAGAPQP
jgi:tetratricopeptide (TPR) repeat protein